MADDLNTQVIKEFRANGGRLSGPFSSMSVVLLHHRGRRTGTERVTPLAYQSVDGAWAVFGSFAGAPHHPDWYRNLVANPRTTIELGSETLDVVARDTTGAERDEIFERQKAMAPMFADYEAKAGDRVIPVVVLERVG